MRILIMDDELYIRELLTDMMEMLGHESVTTSNGEEAIDAYRCAMDSGNPFALCIMDLTIPAGMGGREAIAGILELDPEARSIVASGYSEENVLANYGRFGFTTLLQKPFRFDELKIAIEKAVS